MFFVLASVRLLLLASSVCPLMGEAKWMEIVQEAVIKTIPEKKKCRKAKWLSEEALQIAEKRREDKGKGEKERYTHLNAVAPLGHCP